MIYAQSKEHNERMKRRPTPRSRIRRKKVELLRLSNLSKTARREAREDSAAAKRIRTWARGAVEQAIGGFEDRRLGA